MRIFVDSNIFVAVLTEEDERFSEAKALLNSSHEIVTSMLNLMEVRSVLSKKKNHDREEIQSVEEDIIEMANVIIPDSSDFITANQLQKENFCYPLDGILMAIAANADAELVTFDKELIDNGAKQPSDLI